MAKRFLAVFLYAIMGGICIGIGATAFLCSENIILGALLFTVGLFTICTMNFNLYTGKVSYVLEKRKYRFIDLIFIWLGNLAGTAALSCLLKLTRIGGRLKEEASALCDTKLGDNPLSIFILAVFCNFLIFIAIDSYKNNPHQLGKYLGLFFGVVTFIFCSYEHCVADMYYFFAADAWSLKTFVYLLIITAGNSIGGLIIPVFRKAYKSLSGEGDMERA